MLDTSPKNLQDEIQAAERLRDTHLDKMDEMVKTYTGGAWRGEDGGVCENHIFEYISLVGPRVVYHNPRVKVTAANLPSKRMMGQLEAQIEATIQQAVADTASDPRQIGAQIGQMKRALAELQRARGVPKAMEHGLNQWAKAVNIRNVLEWLFLYQTFAFASCVVTQVPQPGVNKDDPSAPHWPSVTPIHPNRFFFDPLCSRFDEARYAGYKYPVDKDTLKALSREDDSWDYEVIDATVVDSEANKLDRPNQIRGIARNEVVIHEVWVPEKQEDDAPPQSMGFNGTIYTMSFDESGSRYIRKPRAYYGRPRGPFVLFGARRVPGDPWPMSDVQATWKQQVDVNVIAKIVNRETQDYKRIIICGSADVAREIKSGQHDHVIVDPSYDKDAYQIVEVGGVTEQQMIQLDSLRQRLDRNTGIHEAQRGGIVGKGTATEAAIAEDSSTVRQAGITQPFSDGVKEIFDAVGWLLYHDERSEFALGEEVAEEMSQLAPRFQGGADERTPYAELELSIDPYSMANVTEAKLQHSITSVADLLAGIIPIIPSTPYYDWAPRTQQDWRCLQHGRHR